MSTQPTGIAYLWTYSGVLKVLEETLNVSIIVYVLLCLPVQTKTYFLCATAIFSLISTGILALVHIQGITRRTQFSWHWTECVYSLVSGMFFALAGLMFVAHLTSEYIIFGAVACFQAVVYFFDTIDKFQMANTTVPKYAWTVPNMPDLE